jgi:trigger factor
MKVTQRSLENLHDIVSIEIVPSDYQDKVSEKLKDYRKRANIPGFRPGKVPMGLIQKQFGKSVMFDEINEMLSNELSRYLREEKIRTIGNPIPVANNDIDWDSEGAKTFEFEIGLEPSIDIDLKKIKGVTEVEIEISDKDLAEEVENFARRYGKMQVAEEADRNDFLEGKYTACDAKGNPIESEENQKSGSLPLRTLNDKAAKAWKGKKAGESGVLNIEKDIDKGYNAASITGFDAEALENQKYFLFEIEKISKLIPAELNEELFTQVFGEGKVSSEEELKDHLRNQLTQQYADQTKQHLFNQVYEKLMETEVSLPENFIKKLISGGDEPASEEEMPKVFKSLKWQLIRDYILEKNEVSIDEESIITAMKQRLAAQFQLPGNAGDMDELLTSIAKQALEKEEERSRIVDDLLISHLISIIAEQVPAKKKSMSWEAFFDFSNDK